MAIVYGAAGEHAGRQSVAAFKKMFATVLFVVAAVSFSEGIIVTSVFMKRGSLGWLLVAAVLAVSVWGLSRYANRRVDKHETDRLNRRKGALGEYEVGAELERLSDAYSVFNNLNTKRGNLDHIVIGPTGLFAIETKNWAGLIASAPDGELTKNGQTCSIPYIRKLIGRAMTVREQIIALTHFDDFRIRAVMVFPKAYVEAQFGMTGKVHCVRLEKLRDYINNAEYSAKFSAERVKQLVCAVQGISCMDADFPDVGVKHTRIDQNLSARPAVTPYQ